jgi:hypothetical protein
MVIKDNIAVFALLIALVLILSSVMILAFGGAKGDSPAMVELIGAVGTIVGGLAALIHKPSSDKDQS